MHSFNDKCVGKGIKYISITISKPTIKVINFSKKTKGLFI